MKEETLIIFSLFVLAFFLCTCFILLYTVVFDTPKQIQEIKISDIHDSSLIVKLQDELNILQDIL